VILGISEIAKFQRCELCTLDDLGLAKDSNYYRNLQDEVGQPNFYRFVLEEIITLPRRIGRSRGKRVNNWITAFEKLLKAKLSR
jgi:hypothetical protein